MGQSTRRAGGGAHCGGRPSKPLVFPRSPEPGMGASKLATGLPRSPGKYPAQPGDGGVQASH